MIDENLTKIKELIRSILSDSKILLFGSRSRSDFNIHSDYDILIITNNNIDIKEKRQYTSNIRKKLAIMEIDADIIIRTNEDVSYYQNKMGSVTREAVLQGISL